MARLLPAMACLLLAAALAIPPAAAEVPRLPDSGPAPARDLGAQTPPAQESLTRLLPGRQRPARIIAMVVLAAGRAPPDRLAHASGGGLPARRVCRAFARLDRLKLARGIETPRGPSFVRPLARACHLVRARNWLRQPAFAGPARAGAAAAFLQRSRRALAGLRAALPHRLVAGRGRLAITPAALFLALDHAGTLKAARRVLALGRRPAGPPVSAVRTKN